MIIMSSSLYIIRNDAGPTAHLFRPLHVSVCVHRQGYF